MKIYMSTALSLITALSLATELLADIGVPITVPTGETQPQVNPPESAPIKAVPQAEIQKNRAESAPNVESSACRAENANKLSNKLASASCTDSAKGSNKAPTQAPAQNPTTPVNPSTDASALGGR